MTDIRSHKAACRKAAFAARKLAHGLGLDKEANAQLSAYLKEQSKTAVIAGYMPIRTEVSPLPAMERVARRGHDICVPVVIGDGQPLEFHRWTPEAELVEGAFGAMIPAAKDRLYPDIIITPLAAFDMSGYRLGYGGGFYDRSFAELSAQKDITAIGFAYSEQEVMIVPREKTDFRLDAMITEKGILSFS